MKIIEIIIDTKGNTTIETKGYTGATCRDASKFLEEALGQRSRETLTSAFHEHSASQLDQRERNAH